MNREQTRLALEAAAREGQKALADFREETKGPMETTAALLMKLLDVPL